MGVVDDREDRAVVGGGCEEAQDAGTDREALGRVAGREAQCGCERMSLRGGEPAPCTDDGLEQVMQARIRDLRFGLEASRPEHAEPFGVGSFLEKSRLPDPGLAAKDQRATAAASRGVEERADPRLFLSATDQHLAIVAITRHSLVTSAGRDPKER